MAKRFTDTELWNQDWFLDIPKDYKLFYFYMKDACNHAGIFKPNFRVFSALNDCIIDSAEALKFFNSDKERILVLKNGRWLIKDFFLFQYGSKLNDKNKCHQSVLKSLEDNNVKIESLNNVEILEVKETQLKPILKTSNELKTIKGNTEREEQFNKFWELYNKKVDKKKTLSKFLKLKDSDVKKIAETIKNYISINNDVKYRKNPLTYLNSEAWNDEIVLNNNANNFNSSEKVIDLFDNSDLTNTIKKYKTNKENIKVRLNEFLEKESFKPKFKNRETEEVLSHFINSLEYNLPVKVVDLEAKRLRAEKWAREQKEHN